MYLKQYESNNRAFALYIDIKCKGRKRFRLYASDFGRPNSKYAEREIDVENARRIYFSFPVSPKSLGIVIFNVADEKDKEFDVSLMEAPLQTFNVALDNRTMDFLALSIPFSQVAGFVNPPPEGKIYSSENGNLNIRYVPVIRDFKGNPMSTPARVGHQSGLIEAAKIKFDRYTVPMREIILLHEFSHKYKNPQIGLQISNEFGADINALYIYLGLGFSKIDAICVFARVFLKAQTESNMQRMRKIMDYIERFENGEYAQKNLV